MAVLRKIMLAGVWAVVLSSCSTVTSTSNYCSVNSSIHTLTAASVRVDKERVGKGTEWYWNPFVHVSNETRKNNIVAELLREINADVLVDPQFIITKYGPFSGGKITVSGYPGHYENFHTMTLDEATAVGIVEGRVKNGMLSITTVPCGDEHKCTKGAEQVEGAAPAAIPAVPATPATAVKTETVKTKRK